MRVVIVDDESHALRRLGASLAGEPDVEVVARCENGVEAIDAISRLKPDAVFLDVEMPEVDGFDVIDPFIDADCPEVVFVTAYDAYAIRAFDARAVDYVLKPVERPRLAEALDRVRRRLRERRSADRVAALEALVSDLRQSRAASGRDLWVKDRDAHVRVPQAGIIWIEAERDYVRLHLSDRALMMRETMGNMEQRLDPGRFVRVHRSAIVNRDAIRRAVYDGAGRWLLRLCTGAEIRVGRRHRAALADILKQGGEA